LSILNLFSLFNNSRSKLCLLLPIVLSYILYLLWNIWKLFSGVILNEFKLVITLLYSWSEKKKKKIIFFFFIYFNFFFLILFFFLFFFYFFILIKKKKTKTNYCFVHWWQFFFLRIRFFIIIIECHYIVIVVTWFIIVIKFDSISIALSVSLENSLLVGEYKLSVSLLLFRTSCAGWSSSKVASRTRCILRFL